MILADRDAAGNLGSNNLTLTISLYEGVLDSPAAKLATKHAALAASTGTAALISVGAVSATTLAVGEFWEGDQIHSLVIFMHVREMGTMGR